jgi:hypothetical protein
MSRGGRGVDRIGAPLSLDGPELGAFRIAEPFTPFSRESEGRYEGRLRGSSDVVMNRINDLLDEEYRFGDPDPADGVVGVRRFV